MLANIQKHWPTILAVLIAVVFFLFGQELIDNTAGWDEAAKREYARQVELNRDFIKIANEAKAVKIETTGEVELYRKCAEAAKQTDIGHRREFFRECTGRR
jgi:hypothetical protein